jgi:hypothetical protein
MARISDTHDIIVPAQSPNLSAHTYSEVYGGSAGCAIAINSVNVNVGPQSSINIWVSTVSGGTGCFLLGTSKNVYLGSDSVR